MTNDLEAQRTRQRRESAEADAHDAFLGVYQGGKSINGVIARHVDPHTSTQVIVSRIDPDVAPERPILEIRVLNTDLSNFYAILDREQAIAMRDNLNTLIDETA